MPDITMCEGKQCPIKDDCHRYTAEPTPMRQSWFMTVPYRPDTDHCPHFWPNEKNAGEAK